MKTPTKNKKTNKHAEWYAACKLLDALGSILSLSLNKFEVFLDLIVLLRSETRFSYNGLWNLQAKKEAMVEEDKPLKIVLPSSPVKRKLVSASIFPQRHTCCSASENAFMYGFLQRPLIEPGSHLLPV